MSDHIQSMTGIWNLQAIRASTYENFTCHGNGQNAKKLKNTKMTIAGYSPNRNWWNLIGTSKLTMNINSQHHYLLGNQISSKSEDFCIWQPFCTLVTMATTAILNFVNPNSCHTLRWIFLQIVMKFDERNFRNFQNGHRYDGNGQNAKKMIIAGYSPNRNWWNLIGTTSTSSGMR
jgi:hypothetical protein